MNMVVYMLVERCKILRQVDLLKMPILAKKKNHLFKWSSFWSWRVCKQAKLSHLGHRIHWKAGVSKTSHCLMRILVQRHNLAIFLRGEAVTVNGDYYRAMLNAFLFTKIEEEDIGNIWFQLDGATCYIAKATPDGLRPVFENFIINRRTDADGVWPPRRCDGLLFVGCRQI